LQLHSRVAAVLVRARRIRPHDCHTESGGDALLPRRGVRRDFSRPVDEHYRLVAADPQLFTVVPPPRDGVAVARLRPC
jgi:hypothetical protein